MESTFRGEPRSANFADLTERFATQSSRFFHGKHGNSLMNKLLPEWAALLKTFLIREITSSSVRGE